MTAFCGWGATASWYSLDQYRKGERLRCPWSHPVVLNLCINLVITKYKLKSELKLTQSWPVTANCFKVSSQSCLADLSKICFLCTYVDQMIIQQRLLFCFKFSFIIFLLTFFQLFSNVFTNILKIYELPKMYNKIVQNNHLPGQFYVTTSSGFWTLLKLYTWGWKTLSAVN